MAIQQNTAFSVVTLDRKRVQITKEIKRIIAMDRSESNKERLDVIKRLTEMEEELAHSVAILEFYYLQ